MKVLICRLKEEESSSSNFKFLSLYFSGKTRYRGVAQLVERRSPKP